MAKSKYTVAVGSQWEAGGRRWAVTEILPFGRVSIRSVAADGSLGFRFGEMQTASVQRLLDAQVGS